ncbi:DcaP family trimeric outer membrane transporter [Derxia gummosa]|uniref:DcaP family trimeric outer membrane transporter n=1 Tax=Derxia gummosa DSM 723 TaxID=1121388 RepID=A0A8B6X391_9BURK|nr:DcaP family trimeric outer membrane transporter [Derxia gummosa]
MNHAFRPLIAALAGAGLLAAAPVHAGEVDDLKAALQKLQARLDQLEAKQAADAGKAAAATPVAQPAPAAAPAAEVITAGSMPGSIRLPGGTSLKISGYAQLDAAYDLRGNQGRGISLADAPLDGSADAKRRGTTTFSARTSRINFQTATPSELGDVKTRVEFDFYTAEGSETYTNGARPRLRHAYGTVGHWLAGQTWSTFMDVDALPDTLEFFGPTGQVFIRQPQIRYSTGLGAGTLDVALENPQSDSRDVGGNVTAVDRGPDIAARWTTEGDFGHASLRALVRPLRADDGSGDNTASRTGWGLGAGGSLKLGANDTLYATLQGGQGIGRYIQDANSAAAYNAGNRTLSAQTSIGGYVSLTHLWASDWRSSLTYGQVKNRNDAGYGDISKLNAGTREAFANVIWTPVKNIDLGAEYIWGQRKTEDGSKGNVSRIQTSAKFSF